MLALLLALGAPADLKATIDLLVKPLLDGKKNAAVVVGVWRDGMPHVFGYGTAHTRTGDRTPDGRTVFAIGSVTKAVSGVLLADALKRGQVKLDAPANDFLPADLRLTGDPPITLEHLATHRSGLPVQPDNEALFGQLNDPANAYAEFTRDRLAGYLRRFTPKRAAGKRFEYSNLGAGLVGHALVHAAKAESFDQLVKERFARPLGLTDTAEALTAAQRARLADGFTAKGDPGPHWEFASLEACGGLYSTADDLLKLAASVVGDRKSPLDGAIQAAVAPRADTDQEGQRIGLFWLTDVEPGAVWHNGGTYVTRAMLWTVPSTKTAVVVLPARADDRVDGVAIRISKAIQPALK